MPEDPLTIAKEITLAALPRIVTSTSSPEDVGEDVGKLFKAVLQQVNKGIQES